MDEDPITGVDTDDVYRPHQRIRAYQTMKLVCVAVMLASALLLHGVARVVGIGVGALFFVLAMSAVGGATLDIEREEAARARLQQVDRHGQ